jgi:hypothetical protein
MGKLSHNLGVCRRVMANVSTFCADELHHSHEEAAFKRPSGKRGRPDDFPYLPLACPARLAITRANSLAIKPIVEPISLFLRGWHGKASP